MSAFWSPSSNGLLGGFQRASGSPPPTELFPDPNLEDVADDVNGWTFSDGAPFFGPTGGTGPGITADCDFESTGSLQGDDATAFAANVPALSTKSCSLTITGDADGSSVSVSFGGVPVNFPFDGPDTFIQNVTAGAFPEFSIKTPDGVPVTFNITHISVT